MAWLPVILICSVTTASVQAFPSTTREYEAVIYPESQKDFMGQYAQNVQEPSAMLVKDKQLMFEFPTVEFVYQGQGQNVKAEKGTDREKYTHNQNSIETDNNSKNNITENIKQSDSKKDFTENVKANVSNSTTAALIKQNSSLFKTYPKQDEWLLFPKEISAITRSLPKYFYDVLPISPFDEKILRSQETYMLKNYKLENIQPPLTQRTSQPPHIAGPMPYPQSTYAREFDLPFFD